MRCLRALAGLLETDSLVLAALDIDSDWYVVVLLASDDDATATACAERGGYTLKDIRVFDRHA